MTVIILLIAVLLSVPGREVKFTHPVREAITQDPARSALECSQPAAEQDPLIDEAIANQYWVRRVEFSGNQFTADKTLRRRIMLEEDDVFTRENLVKSLDSLGALKKIIYPVKLTDVIVRLNRSEKIIDLTICFREKPRHRTKRTVPQLKTRSG